MQRKRIKSLKSNLIKQYRAVINDITSLSFYSKDNDNFFFIKKNLKNYDSDSTLSEAPQLNKIADSPDPFEYSLIDLRVFKEELLPIEDAIKEVFGEDKSLSLINLRLALGDKNNHISIDDSDLARYDIVPSLYGINQFINENKESVKGFLNREYVAEEGNVYYINLHIANPSSNISSIRIALLSSLNQRGLSLHSDQKYFNISLYIIIQTQNTEDENLYHFLNLINIDYDSILFRRDIALSNWIQIECEQNSENIKGYLKKKYSSLNSFDVSNIHTLAVKNTIDFMIIDKMADILTRYKEERVKDSQDNDAYNITLKKAEIIASARVAMAYLSLNSMDYSLEYENSVSEEDINKYQKELTKY